MGIIQSLKPGVQRKYLLLGAALVWTIAGGILLFRSALLLGNISHFFWLKIWLSLSAGMLFYILLFSRISLKHISRILMLKNEKPCFFSFFNLKDYILMIIMISSGIFLRRAGIVSSENISIIYMVMGIPLLLSSVRFYLEYFSYYK